MPDLKNDPLKTNLTQFQRRFITVCLIGLFFVMSPTVIMYTAGWRFNFATRLVESTGVLSIDVEPEDTTVFLNDTRLTNSLPIRLSGLAPGTYRVRLEKSGFHSWQKDISIQSNETYYIKNITLLIEAEPQKIRSLDTSATRVWFTSSETSQPGYSTTGTPYYYGKDSISITPTTSVATTIMLNKIIDMEKKFTLAETNDALVLIMYPGEKNQTEKIIPATSWSYHAPTKEWRLATAWEITSIYNNGTTTVLYRSDKPMQSVHSLEDTGLMLIISNNQLLAFNPGYNTNQLLAQFDRVDTVETDEINRVILVAGVWHNEPGIFTVSY